jgi:hypothetical protein
VIDDVDDSSTDTTKVWPAATPEAPTGIETVVPPEGRVTEPTRPTNLAPVGVTVGRGVAVALGTGVGVAVGSRVAVG